VSTFFQRIIVASNKRNEASLPGVFDETTTSVISKSLHCYFHRKTWLPKFTAAIHVTNCVFIKALRKTLPELARQLRRRTYEIFHKILYEVLVVIENSLFCFPCLQRENWSGQDGVKTLGCTYNKGGSRGQFGATAPPNVLGACLIWIRFLGAYENMNRNEKML